MRKPLELVAAGVRLVELRCESAPAILPLRRRNFPAPPATRGDGDRRGGDSNERRRQKLRRSGCTIYKENRYERDIERERENGGL